MKLSERLQTIADFVNPGAILADIGTDHGLLPISLWEQQKVSHVILSDIKDGPLEKALENIETYAPGNIFDLRRGGGLSTLKDGEADTVVIAGMGGLLIADILAEAPAHTATFPRFLLQPRNAQDKLRRWLSEHGFLIEAEKLVRERRYIWEILDVKNESVLDDLEREQQRRQLAMFQETELGYEVNPMLLIKKDPLLADYIEKKKWTEEKIRFALQTAGKEADNEKMRSVELRIRKFDQLLKSLK